MQVPAFHPCLLQVAPSVALLVGLVAGGGCGEDSPSGPGEIEIGTGALSFEPLSEDERLEIVAGTQGGYHFIVNARMRGLLPGIATQPGLPGNPLTHFALYLEDGRQADIGSAPYRLGYRESGDSWSELPSGRILQLSDALIESEDLIPNVYEQRVRIQVQIRDARGDEASSEVWVTAGQPTSL